MNTDLKNDLDLVTQQLIFCFYYDVYLETQILLRYVFGALQSYGYL